jgi:hypothetical protein
MIEKDIRRLINLVEEKSEDQTPKQLNESTGATDYNPKSQGGTRKELLAKYHKTNDPKDAEAARKAGATQQELKQTGKEGVAEGNNSSPFNQEQNLRSKNNNELADLIQFWNRALEKNPEHKVAREQLGLIKMIRAGRVGKKGVAEGMDPNKRSRLDDLIDQYKDSVDPEYDSYGSDDHYDSDDIIAQIRSEFGDNIADQVEAGAEKMHFGRPGHKHGYDPLGWRKPIDRQTKAGKMFKQDSDYRKNMVKSRYKLSGKSATEESTTMESKSLIAQGINKILKR